MSGLRYIGPTPSNNDNLITKEFFDDNIEDKIGTDSIKLLKDIDNTGSTDVSGDIQSVIDSTPAHSYINILIPPGTYRIDSGIVIDINKVNLFAFGGVVIDASNMTSGDAITFTASVLEQNRRQNTLEYSGIQLNGPGKASAVTGMRFETSTSGKCRVNLRDISINNFNKGIEIGDNAFLIRFHSCYITSNTIGVSMPSGVSDSGEGINFSQSVIDNNTTGISLLNPNGNIALVNSSLDYNQRHANVSASLLTLTGCHVESSHSTTAASGYEFEVTGNGGTLTMIGGTILRTGSHEPATVTAVLNTTSSNGLCSFHGVKLHNLHNTSKRFAVGTGRVSVIDSSFYDNAQSSLILSDSENNVIDPGFSETQIINPNIFIMSDTASIEDRLIGDNIELSKDNTEGHNATGSLKVTKNFGGGSAAGFVIASALNNRNVTPGYSFWIKTNNDAPNNDIYITLESAVIDSSGTIVPIVAKSQQLALTTLNFGGTSSNWTEYRVSTSGLRMHTWATHMILRFNLDSATAGSIYIDDVVITQM